MNAVRPLLLVLVLFVAVAAAQGAPSPPAPPTQGARMEWWREARFGLFIHWGLYAIPAGIWNGKTAGGTGEWILKNAEIPVADYETLLPKFNPVRFDAKEWARLMKLAGVRYVVITSKHHDGFCLWDSAHTTFDVASSPFRRDVLSELKQACEAEGIRFCLYHSIMDWHHPDYLPRRPWDHRPAKDADFDRFVGYLKGQLQELVTRFRPGVLWFDGEWEDSWTHAHGLDLFRAVRAMDPAIIINNRVDKGRQGMQGMTMAGDFAGDFGTPEQEIPPTGFPGIDWESCMTMNDTWGFRADDDRWKSKETLIRMLVDTASKGGNFLLNVGPTAEGEIPAPSIERLQAIGAWLRVNGEAIYGTTATPFPRSPYRCTVRGEKLYVHVFDWPKGPLDLEGLVTPVRGARLLANPANPLAVEQGPRGVKIGLPERAPDPVASVIVVDCDGAPIAIDLPIAPAKDGSVSLDAPLATITGRTLRVEADKQCLGYWTDPSESCAFDFEVLSPGPFDVVAEIACADDSAGSGYAIDCGGRSLNAKVDATGGWSSFRSVALGRLVLDSKGPHRLVVRPTKKPGTAVMNLRRVTLTPAR